MQAATSTVPWQRVLAERTGAEGSGSWNDVDVLDGKDSCWIQVLVLWSSLLSSSVSSGLDVWKICVRTLAKHSCSMYGRTTRLLAHTCSMLLKPRLSILSRSLVAPTQAGLVATILALAQNGDFTRHRTRVKLWQLCAWRRELLPRRPPGNTRGRFN